MRQSSGFREDNEEVAGYAGEVQQQVRGFSVKEMITGRIVSKCNSNECKVNNNVNKNNLFKNVLSLQLRVNQFNVDQKKASYSRFKVKQRNIFGASVI